MESCSLSFIFTFDPDIILLYLNDGIRVYFNMAANESWIIYGECSLCGECIEGAINPDLRPYNERMDIPVRPEIMKIKNCSLKGVYL